MKYIETVNLIKQKVNLMQQNIINNPRKYIKDNKICYEIICNKLLHNVEKSLVNSWIEQCELNELIKDKKIKLKCSRKKNNNIYSLIDNKGNQIVITNKIKMVNHFEKDNIKIIFVLSMEGDVLNFDYLFNNSNITYSKIDIKYIAVYLKLIND